MKIRSSTKIFIGFVTVVLISFFGYQWITGYLADQSHYPPVTPGRINFVGIDPGSGYRIIVANNIAQLVQASDEFHATETEGGGAEEGAIKKRLPIKELIQSLQGNEEALGRFIMILNEIREDDTWPTVRVVWRKEDLEKAFKGDKTIETKLEHDINMRLDGSPLSKLYPNSLENGIVVDYPVTLHVIREGKDTALVGRVQVPYKPRMIKQVERDYANQDINRQIQAGYYRTEAEKVLANPGGRENIRLSLQNMVSDATAKQQAEAPERILRYATVVLNENQITDAHYEKYDGPDGRPLFNLTIDLTDEGRRRLWKFSRQRVGQQLLLVAEGVAIAAPRIESQLAQGELTIKRMRDEVLVRTAIDLIKRDKVALSQPHPASD